MIKRTLISLTDSDLKLISRAAEKERRCRSNFVVCAAVERAKALLGGKDASAD